jgi:surface carbohydrate biosynthesis protein
MAPLRTALIIPVEEQVREFDAKLLLACVAAERGFPVILGSRTHVHFRIASLPRGIYLAKSMRSLSEVMFSIIRNLGNDIMAWDEEALLHAPPDQYYRRRISAKALGMVSTLFAWGPENAELFRECPDYHGAPIHVTGNPRFDLLRRELRPYFADEAEQIRSRFGDFILINTNFGVLNHYFPNLTSLKPVQAAGKAARGDDYRAGLARHRHAIFTHFQKLVPMLADAFPSRAIVVRPHPVENHAPWLSAAKDCRNVHVVHEGSVLAWLQAAAALIQNSCTTGVEGYLLGVPYIAYQPVQSERFDRYLSNSLGYRAVNFEEVCARLCAILERESETCNNADQCKLVDRFVTAQEGPLASERIVDALERSEGALRGLERPGAIPFAKGWMSAHLRVIEKKLKGRIPGHRNSPEFFRHRFPGVSLDEVRTRIARFQGLLSRFYDLKTEQLSEHIFQITPGRNPSDT